MTIIFACIGCILILLNVYLSKKVFQLNQCKTNLKTSLDRIQKDLQEKQDQRTFLKAEITVLQEKEAQVEKDLVQALSNIDDQIQSKRQIAEESLQHELVQKQEQLKKVETDIDNAAVELKALRDSFAAAKQVQIQEKEKKEKIDFYKLHLSDQDLADVEFLETIKSKISQPVILSKVIWSIYFQKQTTDLCNNVLGIKEISGIYKITNLKTNQVYIGQATNIANRWKTHVKCGLGIDTPVTNKLYHSMKKDGVWNFSFELIEQCPKTLLNEKEKEWIETYQSNKFGLNVKKGTL